ncbi:MAG: UDP-N-acetylmuramoyl-L-alanine--D-glutamate ligase [Erysipelotrichaceae bacterium]|nr:UDP-N-acetylmuramoyl-L-alanine--D-glutamate ligase [Erysipelotrichaceae bacterium]
MKTLVIGAARSGLAISRYLNKRGYEVYLTDVKSIAEKRQLEADGIKVYDEGHPDFLKDIDYDLIIKNPGIKYTVPFVKYFVDKGCPIYNEMDICLHDQPQHRYAAITGTNGKTTTTTLLGGLLKTLNPDNAYCGNIGIPVADVIDGHENDTLQLAIEVGAFQLLGLEYFHPYVSVIMNMTTDHVDYFGTEDAYYRSKVLVYKNQDENDYFLRNVDDENVLKYAQNIPCRIIDFSLVRDDVDLCIRNNRVYYGDVELFDLAHFRLPGMHNVQNAMVAGCMAYLMGVKPEVIKDYIENFRGVEHRIEFVKEINGVSYYNDSKGTNVDSTVMALKAFKQPVHLLAGGYDKKTGYDGLKDYLGNVVQIYAYGDTRNQFLNLGVRTVLYDNLHDALSAAARNARNGHVVLLSPASASWDQYPNFEVRGEEFKRIVLEELDK